MWEEVRAAYRALVKKCHPDQFLDRGKRKKRSGEAVGANLPMMKRSLGFAQACKHYTHTSRQRCCGIYAKCSGRITESALRQLLVPRYGTMSGTIFRGIFSWRCDNTNPLMPAFGKRCRDPGKQCIPSGRRPDAALAMKESATLQGRFSKSFCTGKGESVASVPTGLYQKPVL